MGEDELEPGRLRRNPIPSPWTLPNPSRSTPAIRHASLLRAAAHSPAPCLTAPMPRESSPAELSPLERTARWVEAQAEQTYELPRPPSPRTSIQTSSSYRTTTSSSEDSSPKSPLAPPIISPFAMPAAHVPHATQRPHYDSRSRRASLPFPQSPPGSGYPAPLEVVPPRRDVPEDKQTPRPSIRKQRRPSLIEQIISLGVPSQRRSSREESVRRGQT